MGVAVTRVRAIPPWSHQMSLFSLPESRTKVKPARKASLRQCLTFLCQSAGDQERSVYQQPTKLKLDPRLLSLKGVVQDFFANTRAMVHSRALSPHLELRTACPQEQAVNVFHILTA
eukprot:m.203175 g.203175  ORF g.203175 m.203175 type:complete len:117 (+) comp39619_c0_seq66:207-557(+)